MWVLVLVLTGGCRRLQGGVCVDMSRMNRVLAVSVGDMDCRVEVRVQLEAWAGCGGEVGRGRRHGLGAGCGATRCGRASSA